jgi:hypothetical protein
MRAGLVVLALSATAFAAPSIKGWVMEGAGDYELGLDQKVVHGGRASAHLKAIVPQPREAALLQLISADAYRGRRVRISGWIKSEGVQMAAVGARVETIDGGHMLAYGRDEVVGSHGWTRREVVLDVDPQAQRIALGAGVWGLGEIWVDDFSLEVVDRSVPTTDKLPRWPDAPSNLGFEEP